MAMDNRIRREDYPPEFDRNNETVSVSVPEMKANAVRSGSNAKQPQRRGNPQAIAGRHAVRRPRYINVKKEKKSPFPVAVVLFLAVITVLFIFIMMNYAEIDKYNSTVTDLQHQVAQLQEEPEAFEYPERHRHKGDGKDQRAQEPAAHPETAAPGTACPGNAPEMRFFIDEPEGIPYNITERVPETGRIGGNSGF